MVLYLNGFCVFPIVSIKISQQKEKKTQQTKEKQLARVAHILCERKAKHIRFTIMYRICSVSLNCLNILAMFNRKTGN